MNDNTAAELSESDRPTLAPMLRSVSMPPADTTDVDSRWPEEAPRHSLIAERRTPSSDDPRRQSPLAAGPLALSLDVPRGTDAEAVDASLRDGVLRIRIAKAADAVRRVDIAHGGA